MTQIVTSRVTVTVEELAKMFGIDRQILLNRRCRVAANLPPVLQLKGQREPIWLMEDVLRWLRERTPYAGEKTAGPP